MKRIIVLLCVLSLVLAYGAAFAASTNRAVTTTLNDIPPTWSRTLQCDTTACPRFELVMGGAAVLDHETGLVWEQSPSSTTYAWINAVLVCQNENIGNRKGWRLPTVEELASLVDPTRSNPALPAGHPFTNVESYYYWSATTNAAATTFAWHVLFYDGNVGFDGKAGSFYVWCVRGGQGYDGQ